MTWLMAVLDNSEEGLQETTDLFKSISKINHTPKNRDIRVSRLFWPKIAIPRFLTGALYIKLYIKFVANNGKNRDSVHAEISFCPCQRSHSEHHC